MSREIKFRMFVKGEGMFYRGIYDKNWYKHPKEVSKCIPIKQSDHIFPLMQYTGLKDNKGRAIYEGDILKEEEDRWTDDNDRKIQIVSSELNTSCGSCCTGYIHGWEFITTPEYAEIIGNIYENPELLEKIK